MAEVCQACGHVVETSEDFCGECGVYLNWDERELTEPVIEPEPAAAEPVAAEPAGFTERVKAAVGIGQGSVQTATDDEPAEAAIAPAEEGGAPVDALSAEPAAPTAPVKPGVAPPKPKPQKPPPARQSYEPGDRICGNCSAGNKPTRKFCRKCGHDITEAKVAKVPWYRRLFQRTPKAGPDAGTRPTVKKRRRAPRRIVALLVTLGLVGGAFLFIRPYAGSWWERILDRVNDPVKVAATSATASSEKPRHRAGEVSDKFDNTYWSPVGDGDGANIRFRFAAPFRLVTLRVVPGISGTDEEQLRKVGRPRQLDVLIVEDDGDRTTTSFDLGNGLGAQEKGIGVSDVVRVRLTIDGVYGDAGDGVAIAKVEFYSRKE